MLSRLAQSQLKALATLALVRAREMEGSGKAGADRTDVDLADAAAKKQSCAYHYWKLVTVQLNQTDYI